MLNLVLFRV